MSGQPSAGVREKLPETHQPPWQVQPGDLWQLGSHRLLCGDCTRPDDIARLMPPKEKADLLFTDPPYGVAYAGKSGLRQHLKRQPCGKPMSAPLLLGDDLGTEGTRRLVAAALTQAPLRPGAAFYLCTPSAQAQLAFFLALRDAGLTPRQSLVWVKHHFVLGRQDYQWRHESLLYGWKAGAAHSFYGGRAQDTVWEVPRPRPCAGHPTVKPVALVRRAIENSSRVGEIVYDGFGGSGSTLLACEETGRRCRMLEIEPRFCEVILNRWEEETRKRAHRVCETRQFTRTNSASLS